ncbi:hydroxysqualene dehydroxylase HpnE [Gammaproteobacteria bacterium]|nr:hydroxysqualene dehydroxylase HpnE [Gammaproteobacteria bacterium]
MNKRVNDSGRVYIVGAGLAGLSAAVNCVLKGHKVRLFESTNHAGGRCRSYKDKTLDRIINNGNHLILSGNLGIKKLLEILNSAENFTTMDPALFNFYDIKENESWSLRPSNGRIPWWIFNPKRRIPKTSIADYLPVLKLKYAKNETLAALVNPSRPIFDRLWQPISQAVLNTDAYESSAKLMWTMLSQTLFKGSKASRPMLAKTGLSACLIDPAISFLQANEASIQFSTRLLGLEKKANKLKAITFNDKTISLRETDRVILALPPNEISRLIPSIITPKTSNAIVNVHFLLSEHPPLPNNASFIGIIGGDAHWLFKHDDIYSVTVSAADKLAEKSNEEIATIIWKEVATIIGDDPEQLPLFRVIREMRATFAQTPEENNRRPDSHTNWENLFLAGDWTNTGLPATIESAVISGQKIAEILDKSKLC